jgi:flavin-dependent dehydrogenase
VGTWTEAVANGWWNLCSDGKCATLAFYSTPKILRACVAELNDLLDETKEMKRIVSVNGRTKSRVHVCTSSILTPCAGPRWFAVGDAAMTIQPLASSGITKALRDSQLAVDALESDGGEYDQRYQQEFADYVKSLSAQYGLERRWARSDFWTDHWNDKSKPSSFVSKYESQGTV